MAIKASSLRQTVDLPELGQVTVRPLTHEAYKHANDAACAAEPADAGRAFVLSLVVDLVDGPALDAEAKARLSDEAMNALIPALAKSMDVVAQYDSIDPSLSAPDRLLNAFRLRMAEMDARLKDVGHVIRGAALGSPLDLAGLAGQFNTASGLAADPARLGSFISGAMRTAALGSSVDLAGLAGQFNAAGRLAADLARPGSFISEAMRTVEQVQRAGVLAEMNRSLDVSRSFLGTVSAQQQAIGSSWLSITGGRDISNIPSIVSSHIASLASRALALDRIISDAFQPVRENFEVWLTQSMADTLHRYGWWYAPTMPRDLVVEVHKMALDGKGRSINARICRHYHDNNCRALQDMITRWYDLPYFHKRQRLFEAALKAHRRGEYTLSIPALLPHLEGIAQEFVLDLGMIEKVYWEAIAELLGTSQTRARGVMVESFGHALVQTFFARFHPEEEYKGTRINRHAIMHGRLVKYPSKANSVRAFLALESLHYFLHELLSKHPMPQLKTVYQTAVKAEITARKAQRAASRQAKQVAASTARRPGSLPPLST